MSRELAERLERRAEALTAKLMAEVHERPERSPA